MGEIGGLSPQKQLLRELVLYPLSNPSITGQMSDVLVVSARLSLDLNYISGVQFPKGVLLYGSSGVGKSLLVSALCSETSAHVVSLSLSDLHRSGQSLLYSRRTVW